MARLTRRLPHVLSTYFVQIFSALPSVSDSFSSASRHLSDAVVSPRLTRSCRQRSFFFFHPSSAPPTRCFPQDTRTRVSVVQVGRDVTGAAFTGAREYQHGGHNDDARTCSEGAQDAKFFGQVLFFSLCGHFKFLLAFLTLLSSLYVTFYVFYFPKCLRCNCLRAVVSIVFCRNTVLVSPSMANHHLHACAQLCTSFILILFPTLDTTSILVISRDGTCCSLL